ncbi:hypothetical protein E3P94_00069 [Wallemia ichthyophaga]|nr:hypothetical protein E3P95_00069 [Wallemia ichthyophaga]TIB06002.1 hypothetical protein E3P94_00069 [Wallemia ichthyophaga]
MDNVKASVKAFAEKRSHLNDIKVALSRSSIPQDDHKTAIENAFREDVQAYSSTRSISPQFSDGKVCDDYHIGLLFRLGVLVELLKSDIIPPNSVVPIISDTLDIHSLSSATVIFNFLTDFMASDDSNVVKTTSTRNNLLKTSNELLRRASRTRNSELCGEILLFLTSIMPLTDRSATNFRGDIRESTKTIPDALMMSDEADDGYRNFWHLQSYLTNPMSIYDKTAIKDGDKEITHTERFKSLFSSILQLLVEASDKEIKMSGSTTKKSSGGMKRKLNEAEILSDAYFFPEYLAQPKLFPLQVADPSFRCCVFIQMFIIVQFIVSVHPKDLLYGPEIQNPQEKIIKSGIQSDKTFADWATSRRSNILKALPKVSPHNVDITQPIVQLMKREKHWVYWKMENCPMIELPSDDPSLLTRAEESRMANVFKNINASPYVWGTEALSESFEEGYKNADDLEQYPRPPELSFYVKKAKQDTMKAMQRRRKLGVGEDAQVANDPVLEDVKNHKQSLSWRGFRCVAKNSAPIIASLPPGSDVEGLYEAIERKKQQAQAKGVASKDNSPSNALDVTQIVGDGQRHDEQGRKEDEEEEMNIEKHLSREHAVDAAADSKKEEAGEQVVEQFVEQAVEQDGKVIQDTKQVKVNQTNERSQSQPPEAEEVFQTSQVVMDTAEEKMVVQESVEEKMQS